MTFERVQVIFFTVILILATIVAAIGGITGWIVGIVMLGGVPTLFAYGCHKAAQEKAQTTRDKSESTLDLILSENGDRLNMP
jgi:ABC-type antimicrobial peptide transport system permease subunit